MLEPVAGHEKSAFLGLVERAWDASLGEQMGLVAMVAALGLLVSLPYLAKSRRQTWMLLGAILILAGGGYAVYDWRYVALSVTIRDAENIRVDCERLMREPKLGTRGFRLMIDGKDADFPDSFRGVGSTYAAVWRDIVYLGCPRYSPYGVLFEPKRAVMLRRESVQFVRRLWPRDFYMSWEIGGLYEEPSEVAADSNGPRR